MTDNKIIKALECISGKGIIRCKDCPYRENEFPNCYDLAVQNAIDLINRQKVEVAHFKEEANKYQKFWCNSYNKQEMDDARAEAIKEFADRLKEKAKIGKGYLGNVYHSVAVEEIDNLVKEMTESEGKENA